MLGPLHELSLCLLPLLPLFFHTTPISTKQMESPLNQSYIWAIAHVFAYVRSVTAEGGVLFARAVTMIAAVYSQLGTHQLSPCLSGERLRALDRCTNRTIDDQLRQHAECAGNTEQNSVEVLLGQTVVLQQHT